MFDTTYSPSWNYLKAVDHYEGKKYECEYCGVTLQDHEAHLINGKPFCGCCQ